MLEFQSGTQIRGPRASLPHRLSRRMPRLDSGAYGFARSRTSRNVLTEGVLKYVLQWPPGMPSSLDGPRRAHCTKHLKEE